MDGCRGCRWWSLPARLKVPPRVELGGQCQPGGVDNDRSPPPEQQGLLPVITRQPADQQHKVVAGVMQLKMKSGRSGAQVLWREQGHTLGGRW